MTLRQFFAGLVAVPPKAAKVTRGEMTDEERFRLAEQEWQEKAPAEQLKALESAPEIIMHDLAFYLMRILEMPDITERERAACRAGLEVVARYVLEVVRPRWITARVFALKDTETPF